MLCFIVCAGFLLLLVRVCMYLGLVNNTSGSSIMFCVFCCLFEFFFDEITDANLLLLLFCQILQVLCFIVCAGFSPLFVRVCVCLRCVHDLCGAWLMFCVLVYYAYNLFIFKFQHAIFPLFAPGATITNLFGWFVKLNKFAWLFVWCVWNLYGMYVFMYDMYEMYRYACYVHVSVCDTQVEKTWFIYLFMYYLSV